MIDINELRRLAQAATPGPWKLLPVGDRAKRFAVADINLLSVLTVAYECGTNFGAVYLDGDAKFIAAANPAAINELLDRLEAVEKERDALRAENAALVDDMNLLRDNNTTLRAKLERVEKQRDGLIGTMRVLAARPAVDEGRNNWEAIVWESIGFAEEAIARTTGDQP